MKNLVIVESPAKASTIESYLGPNFKVVASKGHVRDLPKSTLGVDIDNNFDARYINIRGKGPLIKELKKEAKNAKKIFLATDPDREGEAISWHLATTLGIPIEDTNRVAFNEITKTAIESAIKNSRTINMDLVNSQQARRILDRIVGYKLSPFLWKNVKSGLSAGRVQSVTTRVIVERENEIRKFIPVEYWTIDALLKKSNEQKLNSKFYGDQNGKIDLKTEEEILNVLKNIGNSDFIVKSVKKAVRYKNPSPPFITSTMQQEASKKLGYQSQRTMKIAQELYEGINLSTENGGVQGLITYMRTDSLRIASEAVDAAKIFICGKFGENYYPKTPQVYKSEANSQDAHEAIRPSNLEFEPDKIKKDLTSEQFKLYKLIWGRFIASQMKPAEIDTVTVHIQADKYIFHSNGYTIKFLGYMAIYQDFEETKVEKGNKLPELSVDEILNQEKIEPLQHFTEPPPRYTEASLIKFLEEMGIGRPSTYTPIITTIIARSYVKRENKSLVPTPLGEITTNLMIDNFPDIVNYKFTATMENDLDGIEKGESTILKVLQEFYTNFEKALTTAESTISKSDIKVPIEETDILCEKCGSRMIIKNGRYGKFAACPNYPECKNTKPINKDGKVEVMSEDVSVLEKIDFKCEICGSDMELRFGRYGAFYACTHYPECKGTKQITKDIGVACPICGDKIVTKRGKNKTVFYSCEKYPDCKFSSWDLPLNEQCPDCNQILYRKKGKNLIICHNKECGYKREVEEDMDTESEKDNI